MFDGTIPSYFSWRAAFIQNIHPVYCQLNLKVQIIKETLSLKDSFLRSIVSSLRDSPDHYRDALTSLEETYGNPEKMVMGLVNGLCNHPAVSENDHGSLLGLIQELNSIKMTLVQSGLEGTFNSPLMLQAALALFPMNYQCKYHDWLQDFHPDDQPSLDSLLIFGKRQARTLSRSISHALPVVPKLLTKRTFQHAVQDVDGRQAALGSSCKSHTAKLDGLIEELSLSAIDDDSETEQTHIVRVAPPCPLCSGQAHLYRICPKFIKLSIKDRRAHLIETKKCFRCFREGHNMANCQSRLKCRKCKEQHNTLVCLKDVPEAQNLNQDNDILVQGPPASLPIVAILLENPNTHKTIETNALLDTGAQRSFISEHIRTKLALTGHAEPYHSMGFGGVKTSFNYSVSCVVRAFTLDRLANSFLKVSSLPDPVGDLYPEKTSPELMNHPSLKDLKLAPVLSNVKVEVIIGTDNPVALKSNHPDVLLPGGPLAKHSMFGYVLMGQRQLDVIRQDALTQAKEYSALIRLDPLFVRSYRDTYLYLVDIGFRGSSISDLVLGDLWINDAQFLTLDKTHWPQPHGLGQAANEALTEVKSGCTLEATYILKKQDRVSLMEVDILTKFNSLHKATKTLALVVLFVSKCKSTVQLPPRSRPGAVRFLDCSISWPGLKTVKFKKLSMLPILTPVQLQLAEDRIVSKSQLYADPQTYDAIKTGSEVQPSDVLRELCLFIDDKAIVTQFHAASTARDKSLNDPSLLVALCAKFPKVKFRFAPARTLHANGIMERIIQNSPDDLRPLTPAHFLAGSALRDASPIAINSSLAKCYNLVRETLDKVWIRYQKEVLLQLRIVNKWLAKWDSLLVGDVVIIMDDQDRSSFRLGRITETHPSPSDGIVRSVSINVGNNVWRCHVSSLLLLVRPEHNQTDDPIIS
jgi:hypothetical protein